MMAVYTALAFVVVLFIPRGAGEAEPARPNLHETADWTRNRNRGRDWMADQATVTNQKAILANQRTILANQRKIEANQRKLDLLLRNQKKLDAILANQKRILSMLR
jgi:hypothetical protein